MKIGLVSRQTLFSVPSKKKKSHVSGVYQKSCLFRSFVYTHLSVDQVDRWSGSVQVSERTLVTDVHRHVFVM